MQIMSKNHYLWKEFIYKLVDKLDANECDSSSEMPHTKSVLSELGFNEDEIIKSLEYLEGYTAHCDCEVLLNADADKDGHETESEGE